MEQIVKQIKETNIKGTEDSYRVDISEKAKRELKR